MNNFSQYSSSTSSSDEIKHNGTPPTTQELHESAVFEEQTLFENEKSYQDQRNDQDEEQVGCFCPIVNSNDKRCQWSEELQVLMMNTEHFCSNYYEGLL